MHQSNGDIGVLSEMREKYKELLKDKKPGNEIIPLSDKEYKSLEGVDQHMRPAHLAWMRLQNKGLPPKLMFVAGFEAARKIFENKE